MGRVSQRAAFLDRDGTLNVRPREHGYVTSVAEFAWLPGAASGAARLASAGYLLAVASNQRGVARGLVDARILAELEGLIQRTLARHGCAIEAFRYCVHDEDAECSCRKPRSGMIVRLARELDLDLARSWMIGDSESDVVAGQGAGCRTALVGTAPARCEPDLVAESLDAASEMIVREDAQLGRRLRRDSPRTPRRARDRSIADRRRG
jgi:D-glycero-D-manno-heptose 1,7-bisphosphate phosphatase